MSGTDCDIPIFASGWDDGAYPCYFGYDADDKVCSVSLFFFDVLESVREEDEARVELLLSLGVFGNPASVCTLPNEEKVNFYQVIPLYREEK